jgi:hypothetical protein
MPAIQAHALQEPSHELPSRTTYHAEPAGPAQVADPDPAHA